jgi:hypothetical protein
MKIRPAGAELFDSDGWTDRRTDVTKLTVAIRKFAITLQNDGFSIKTLSDWPFKWKQFFFVLYEARIKFLKQMQRNFGS